MSGGLTLVETCKFRLEPSREQAEVLEQIFSVHADMVKECLNKAIEENITSRGRMHGVIYRKLRDKYPEYPTRYISTAITQALGMFKSYRYLSRKRRNIKPPHVDDLAVVHLVEMLFWFNWGSLRLATHKGHITIPFKVYEYAKKFYDWKIGDSDLVKSGGEYYFLVSFKKEVKEGEISGVMGIDVNEKSIDLAVVKPDKVKFIKIDISEAKYIKDRYFRKRRSIQMKTSGEKRKQLLSKYSGRESRRVDAILHKASKIIAEIVKQENVQPVMEDLKNMREHINYGKKLNRRLHSMPFRKIQTYITYKSMENGYVPAVIDARNTSRTCPICGSVNKPNGHVFECSHCGFQADRHFVASWNIATKLPMWGALRLPPNALDEPQIIEVKGKG